jgi:hypothetical protein
LSIVSKERKKNFTKYGTGIVLHLLEIFVFVIAYNNCGNVQDILPFNYTRVPLSDYPGVPGSDYINANYIKGQFTMFGQFLGKLLACYPSKRES